MIHRLLKSARSTFWRLAHPALLASGALLVMLGLGAIALPLLLGLTLLAIAQWVAGEYQKAPTVELAAD